MEEKGEKLTSNGPDRCRTLRFIPLGLPAVITTRDAPDDATFVLPSSEVTSHTR